MKLKNYLARTNTEPKAFAKKIAVSWRSIYRYLEGCRPGGPAICRIKAVTGGKVTERDFFV